MEASRSREGYGWVVFAGILLILAGLFDIVNGIRAIGAQDTAFDTIFWDNNLEAWGWFYLIVGVVLLVAGISIFNRAPWAVLVVGIAVAVVAAVVNMFWIFVYPIHSLIVIIVCLLIAYGLSVCRLETEPTTNAATEPAAAVDREISRDPEGVPPPPTPAKGTPRFRPIPLSRPSRLSSAPTRSLSRRKWAASGIRSRDAGWVGLVCRDGALPGARVSCRAG